MPALGIGPVKPDEFRLSGNGEETRFRLTDCAGSAEMLKGQ